MDDDRLRRELERRATRAATPDFVSEIAPRLSSDRAQPARVARWAPLAGAAAAAVIVLALVIAFPRSPSTPAASTPAPSVTVVEPSLLDCGQLPAFAYLSLPVSTVSVVDSTGLIDSCSTELRPGTWPNVDTQAFVAGVTGQDAVEVAWNMQHCGPESVSVRVGSQGDKYAITLVLDRLAAGGVACVDTITSKHVVLHVPSGAVAGLSAAPVSVAILAPSDDLTIRPTQVECSPAPGATADAPHTTLYDDTHLVTSCEAVEPGGGAFLTAANPNGDEHVLDVNWSATPCEAAPTVHVGKLSNGYFVHGALPKAPCSQPPVAQTLRIQLNAAMAAGDVIVQFDRDGPTTSGGPPARVACTDAPDVTIVDSPGVVQSCAAAESPASLAEDVVFTNPGSDKNVLQISWLGPGAPCNYEVHLTQPDDKYTLDIYAMDDTCRQARVVRTVALQLTKPIEPWQIDGWSDQVPGQRPSPAPSPPAASVELVHYAGEGFNFDYPANWQILTGSQRFGIHGPAILAAVGQFGSIDAGCTVNSDVVACRSSPIWNVRDDGIVLAHHIGAWLGPISPMPTPSLAPGQTFVDVGGRRAIFSQTPYDSMTWAFTDAPDLIELRWGSNYPGNADDVAQAVIDTWHFDAGYQP